MIGPRESWCLKGWGYHKYVIVKDHPDYVSEVCVKCSDRVGYNKVAGSYDDKKWARAHFREFLQPIGKMIEEYVREYGPLGKKMR